MTTRNFQTSTSRWPIFLSAALAVGLGAMVGIMVGLTPSVNLLLVATVGIIVAILSLTNLEFGLLVFIILTYLRVSDIAVYIYGAPSIARPFFLLLIAAIALRWAVTGNLPKGWFIPTVLIISYGLVVFGSIFYAADFASAQGAAEDYWKDGLISVLIAALIQKREVFRHVIWALILSGIFLGTISVYQYATGTFSNYYFGFAISSVLQIVGTTEGTRVGGPIGDANFFAQIMVVLIPLAINRMIFEKSTFLKLVAAYGVLVITLTVIFTFSRGGLFGIMVALLVLGICHPPKVSQMVGLLILGVFILFLVPRSYIDRIATITDVFTGQSDIRNESSLSRRASGMSSAWMMFVDHPVLGVGLKNYEAYYQQYSRKLGLDSSTGERASDSLFLELAAETGMIGILVFGLILFYVFKYIGRARKIFGERGDKEYKEMVGAFLAGFMGYLATAIFLPGAYMRYFWLLVGIAFSLPNILKDESSLEKTDH
jgi:putative inorganic carbon (hco3(-)) transporter